ncbi:DUF928 domain-containing protein [Kovacikia minuta CCNUW1]|uniref:DUF928 domain-containing protein n=1 Tax=Kovacikia minuta TaxID=2931930 RepID=UPI001CCE5687|nr:DUF928 domain-containing protein [Kovacikia minuta]UBF27677.1 DUF928 domain-containing protein [Kovacikia minuta CCNUW1]
MTQIRVSFWHRLLTVTLALLLVWVMLSPLPVQAASEPKPKCILWIFCSKDDLGRGNASRGPCAGLDKGNLTALLPVNRGKPVDTIAPAPTFWVYIPYTSHEAKFMLLDQGRHPVLKQPIHFDLESAKPGIAQFTLTANNPAWLEGKSFEVGKPYNWYFSVICDREKPARNPVVSGWIRRTVFSPDLEQKWLATPAPDQYPFLVQNEIWSDALTHLVQNHAASPEDWQTLLKLLGLDTVGSDRLDQINRLTPIPTPVLQ